MRVQQTHLRVFRELVRDRNLMRVVTALRGPDWDGSIADVVKELTTSVIRHLVLEDNGDGTSQHHAARSGQILKTIEEAKSIWLKLTLEKQKTVRDEYVNHWHFNSHIQNAFIALGGEGADYFDWLQEQFTVAHDTVAASQDPNYCEECEKVHNP